MDWKVYFPFSKKYTFYYIFIGENMDWKVTTFL